MSTKIVDPVPATDSPDTHSQLSSACEQFRKGGRPKCTVAPPAVIELRGRGCSWRQIARALQIGSATAMRLHSLGTSPLRPKTPESVI